jgi:hypothetical protein
MRLQTAAAAEQEEEESSPVPSPPPPTDADADASSTPSPSLQLLPAAEETAWGDAVYDAEAGHHAPPLPTTTAAPLGVGGAPFAFLPGAQQQLMAPFASWPLPAFTATEYHPNASDPAPEAAAAAAAASVFASLVATAIAAMTMHQRLQEEEEEAAWEGRDHALPRTAQYAAAVVASNRRFRTKFCVYWLRSGGHSCPYGERCLFAHSQEELRLRPRALLALAHEDELQEERERRAEEARARRRSRHRGIPEGPTVPAPVPDPFPAPSPASPHGASAYHFAPGSAPPIWEGKMPRLIKVRRICHDWVESCGTACGRPPPCAFEHPQMMATARGPMRIETYIHMITTDRAEWKGGRGRDGKVEGDAGGGGDARADTGDGADVPAPPAPTGDVGGVSVAPQSGPGSMPLEEAGSAAGHGGVGGAGPHIAPGAAAAAHGARRGRRGRRARGARA